MRRMRKVIIAVSEDFYNKLNEGRNKYCESLNKKIGFNKHVKMSIPSYTSIMASRIDFSGFGGLNAKQKRRRY